MQAATPTHPSKKLKLDTSPNSKHHIAGHSSTAHSPTRPPVSPITPTPSFKHLSAPAVRAGDSSQRTSAQQVEYFPEAPPPVLSKTTGAADAKRRGEDATVDQLKDMHSAPSEQLQSQPAPQSQPQHDDHCAEPRINSSPHTHPDPSLPPPSTQLLQTSSHPPISSIPQQPPQLPLPHPAPNFISPPPPLPLSPSNPDILALTSAISILQHQRQKSLSDISTLSRLKSLATSNPNRFITSLLAGDLTAEKGTAADPLRATFEGPELSSDEEDEEEDGESGGGGAKRKKVKSEDEFPKFPAPQNVIRMPPINWAKYHIIGEPLERMHEEQVKRPTAGEPSSGPITGNYTTATDSGGPVVGVAATPRGAEGGEDVVMGGTSASAGVGVGHAQQSGLEQEHHVFAPYSAFRD